MFVMQVYNETIRDLLMPGQPLAVREDPQRGVCVSGLTLHKVTEAIQSLVKLLFTSFLSLIYFFSVTMNCTCKH